MFMSKDGKITVASIVFPLSLVAFVLFLLLAFQASQIMRERDALHEAKTQQNKPLEDAQKVQSQLDALALGTKKLAQQGDKNAEAIINRMKQLGITVGTPPASTPGAVGTAKPSAPASQP